METKGGILTSLYHLLQAVPVREKFSIGDEAFIQQYGSFPINRIKVCRTPLSNIVGKALNAITIGAYERAMAKYGVDALFHLFMLIDIVDVSKGGKIITAILEKNETPRCHLYDEPLSNNTQCVYVMGKYGGNLKSLIGATQAEMGRTFWVYNAFTNNCQDFLLNVLGSNGLLTEQLQTFIKQDVSDIVREMPSYTPSIAQHITDTMRKVRTVFGLGLDLH